MEKNPIKKDLKKSFVLLENNKPMKKNTDRIPLAKRKIWNPGGFFFLSQYVFTHTHIFTCVLCVYA